MPIPSIRPRTPIGRTGPGAPPSRVLLAVGAAALLLLPVLHPLAAVAAPSSGGRTDLGPAVHVFTPGTPQATIQSTLDGIAAAQSGDQFGTRRDAVLFAPGTYGSAEHPLKFQVGYYTEVAGLGASPKDVVINGSVDVFNQCDADGTNCIALNNFWRSLSNLSITPLGGDDCRSDTEFWAVSQASPMRRVAVNGKLTFMDYCSAPPQYASGGFLADSAVSSTIVSGSQQQFYTRNSSIGGWSNGVWNQVFSGVQGAPEPTFPTPNPYTVLGTTPASKEKPYLVLDRDGRYAVTVPAARTATSGTSWASGATRGRTLGLDRFYTARPGDSARTMQRALDRGKSLLLTPGVYSIDRTLQVRRPGTVVLGLGIATLTAKGGVVPLRIADVPGVDVAGLMVDAGAQSSSALIRIDGGRRHGRGWEPIALQDVFFRVGGPHAGRASTSLRVDADDVILDDIWAWRADHGTGVGWTRNTAANGVVVNGDDVTATGLFVEHYQRYNVVWNGERGRTVFFQNELPYDAPNQAAWRHGKVLGWAAYKVGDRVRHHELWGGGSYIYTNVDPTLHATRAFEVPERRGVVLHDVLTVSLNKAGTIDHVVNDTGAAVTPERQGPEDVVRYPAG